MDRDTDLIPSSPTNSSASSSDLDTEVESTGSFFHDRSTSLGTLMGVNFPEIHGRPVMVPSRRDTGRSAAVDGGGRKPNASAAEMRRRRHRGGRSWWRLCREEMGSTSLGEFLQVERRMGGGGGDVAERDFLYGGGAAEHEVVGGGALFEDGRVLPPLPPPQRRQERAGEAAGSLGRLPVLFTGICSGGEG